MNQARRVLTVLALASSGAVAVLPGLASAAPIAPGASAVKLLACSGATVERPAFFTITCADGYTELTKTHWTNWTATSAHGVTTFGLNLCKPYCAASRISLFPNSTVALSAPRPTKHGKLFSKLVVTYKLHGKISHLTFSWVGDPSF
jgi:hypothetical protein